MPQTDLIDVAGKKTQVTVGGSGPPLVYLHSAGGETDWMPFHELLAEHYTVYVPAHPGFALSGGLDEIRDMQDYVWHTVDLLAALKLNNVPVVGFSLGGWLGAELAVLRPNLVSKLVLTNAVGLHVPGAPLSELFIDDLEEMKRLMFYDLNDPAIPLALPTGLDDPRILMWLRAREATARVGWNPYLHNPRLKKHLHRIACPTLVLWGRHDKMVPLAHGECYVQHIPGAKLHVLENCAHMLPFEKPREFAAAVREFVGA